MIPNSSQVKEFEKHTMKVQEVTEYDLMHRAAHVFVDRIKPLISIDAPVTVICGSGNNGGDGLVIARLLANDGYKIDVLFFEIGNASDTNRKAFSDLPKRQNLQVTRVDTESPLTYDLDGIVIDAIFGAGLNRAIDQPWSDWIHKINDATELIIAVDIPSGLPMESPPDGSAIRADHTIAFEYPKLNFFFKDYSSFVGNWIVESIGLEEPVAVKDIELGPIYVWKEYVPSLHEFARDRFAHKGDFGHALLVVGSKGMMGAATMATEGALRMGAGKITACIPQCGYQIIQSSSPEAMVLCSEQNNFIELPPALDWTPYDVVGIGCGIGQSSSAKETLEQALVSNKPLVIDADGLNILSENSALLDKLPPKAVLTPHVGEFDRLFGRHETAYERYLTQKAEAQRRDIYIILKGAYTSICSPSEQTRFNSTGNPGMATAGMGDVLTGVLCGAIAQYGLNIDALSFAVYIHGLAGDFAEEYRGQRALLARDVIDYISEAQLACESMNPES